MSGRSVTGIIHFDEVIQLLQNAAQTHDEGNQQRRRPRYSRSANIHQLDDDGNETSDDEDDYDVNLHDAHTQVEELLAHMSSVGHNPGQERSKTGKFKPSSDKKKKPFNHSGPGPEDHIAKARLPPNKWHGLSQKGKEFWGKMTEDDKRTIITMAHEAFADGQNAHEHDIADGNEDDASKSGEEGREVKVHDLLWPSRDLANNGSSGEDTNKTTKEAGLSAKEEKASPKKSKSVKKSESVKTSDGRKVAPDHGKGVDIRAMLSQSNVARPKYAVNLSRISG